MTPVQREIWETAGGFAVLVALKRSPDAFRLRIEGADLHQRLVEGTFRSADLALARGREILRSHYGMSRDPNVQPWPPQRALDEVRQRLLRAIKSENLAELQALISQFVALGGEGEDLAKALDRASELAQIAQAQAEPPEDSDGDGDGDGEGERKGGTTPRQR